MSNNGKDAGDELAALIDAALHLGADGARIVRLAREHGWRPLAEEAPEVDVLEGVLANGTHVPIRILRAARSRLSSR